VACSWSPEKADRLSKDSWVMLQVGRHEHFGEAPVALSTHANATLPGQHPALIGSRHMMHMTHPPSSGSRMSHTAWRPSVRALVFSFFAGLSLPLGAWIGHSFGSVVSDAMCAGFMALGAGSLLFAVTVEIYGHTLTEMKDGSSAPYEVAMTTVGGLVGAAFFMKVNKMLEQFLIERESVPKDELSSVGLGDTRAVPTVDPQRDGDDRSVALSLYAGLVIDGVPEGVLMGFLAAEGHFSLVFAVSVFIAQFPEAFVAASLFKKTGMKTHTMFAMWGGLCLVSVALAGMSCAALLRLFPGYAFGERLPVGPAIGVALVEGVTGGAMIACIAATMLPEALERTGKNTHILLSSGFLCASGFLLAVALKAVEG